jgi:type II secretory pathway component GspD/PulD (secretin)
MVLPLLAAAQTNSFGTRLGQPRTRISAPTNSVPPALPAPPAPNPASSAEAAANNPAPVAAQPPQPAASPANPAPAAVKEERYLGYHWTMPIEQVLENIYAPLVERTPLRAASGAASIPKDALITLNTYRDLTKSEAIMALETVLGMNGVTVVPIGDEFFKVVADTTAGRVGGILSSNSAAELPDAGKFITEIIQLRYANPEEVVKALGLFGNSKSPESVLYISSTGSLILRDYTENVKRELEMVEKLDVESALTVKSEIIPIRYALAEDISAALSQLGAGAGGGVGKSSTGAGSFSKSTTSTTAGGTAGGFGSSSQGGLSTGASGSRSTFGQRLGNIVSGAGGAAGGSLFGQTKIIADERTNSLLVFANDEDMKMIKKIIKDLDVVLAQVLIEAIFLDVSLNDSKSVGVSFSQNPSTRGQFTGAGGSVTSGASSYPSTSTNSGSGVGSGNSILSSLPQGLSYFGQYGNDFNAILEAAASDGRVTVLSRPQIQTSHAVEAELFIGSTVPYVTGTQNYGYSTGPSANYTQLEVGIRMKILPLINPDGLVVMDIDQEIEEISGSQNIQGVGNVPTTSKDDFGAKVAVMSGDTIILGGFINANRSLNHDGVPYLMDIPVLGNLFKSSSSKNTREELIVLIRPTVLRTPQIAARVATEERDRMAGVKQAELEIRKDEDDRNAKANQEILKKEAKKAAQAQKAGPQATNQPLDVPPNLDIIDTNQTVKLHLKDTNTEAVIEKAKP